MARFRKRAAAVVAALCLIVAGVAAFADSTDLSTRSSALTASSGYTPSYWSKFSNSLPTSSDFFPIAVFDQSAHGGDVQSPYTNQAQVMVAAHINVEVGSDSDSYAPADLSAACAAGGPYLIVGNEVRSTSVAGLESDINANPSCAKYGVGYQAGDEGCNTSSQGDPSTVIPADQAIDPTRIVNWGQAGGFPTADNICATPQNASDVFSGDVYEVTNPYIGSTCNVPGKQSDCLWGYGEQTQNYVSADTNGKPVWVDLETGTDDLGMSSADGSTCNSTTNLCANGNEQRATPEQVNSAAWLTLINGSNGLLWFCDDGTTGADACLGGGSDGNPTNCAPTCGVVANLTYIDGTVEGYAQELNSQSVAGVTISSSNSAVPVDEMTKVVDGVTYLFAEADRGTGTTNATYTVPGAAGDTATLVYDSAQHYDPSGYNDVGNSFTLNGSGAFTDSLTGDTGNAPGAVSYQVKIYTLSTGGGTTTTTTMPATTTTTQPATTTTTTTQPPVNVTATCNAGWLNTTVNPQRWRPTCTFSAPSGIPYHTYINCTGTYTVGSTSFTLVCKT